MRALKRLAVLKSRFDRRAMMIAYHKWFIWPHRALWLRFRWSPLCAPKGWF